MHISISMSIFVSMSMPIDKYTPCILGKDHQFGTLEVQVYVKVQALVGQGTQQLGCARHRKICVSGFGLRASEFGALCKKVHVELLQYRALQFFCQKVGRGATAGLFMYLATRDGGGGSVRLYQAAWI